MGRPKIIVAPNDYERWGKLVKTWATGKNYVDYASSPQAPVPTTQEIPPKFPRPTSFAEFVDQCALAQVSIIFDDGKNTPVPRNEGMGLIVIQGDADVHVIRLPPVEKLLESEQRFLAQGATYKLPGFYSRIFGGVPEDPQAQASNLDRMKIHAERVGEYTLNTCG